jgi:4-aminobutyrate aminotransferase-like enzyme/Ser/Thr protein kinase RdoA (MazF antagonist)
VKLKGPSAEGLLALRGRPPAADTATAEVVAYDLYGLTARATALEGERDRNFRLDTADSRRLVLKFIDHEADDVVVDGQSAALAHIAEQNPLLPVPRVIRTLGAELIGVVQMAGVGGDDTAVSCRARLVTYLPGRLMQDVGPAGGPDVRAVDAGAGRAVAGVMVPTAAERNGLLRSVGNHIAQLDRALVGFFHPALAQPIAWDVRRAPALLPMLAQVQPPALRRALSTALDPVQQLLQKMRGLRSQAIHGDCHGRNLLVNDDGDACVGIIDLGDMIHAPLVLEIAVTMAEFLTDGVASLDELPELLGGYTSLQPLERADVDVLYDLMAARIAVGVLIQVWREQNNARGAAPAPGANAAAGTGSGPATDAEPRARSGPATVPTSASTLAAAAANALDALASRGKGPLTQQWLEAAGIASVSVSRGRVSGDLVRRRHNALGANAELSYDQPLHLVRGEGVWVYTSDAERLLDVYNNVPHVGHAHPAVVAAIANQAKRIASNTRYLDIRIIEYVERLTATLPPDLDTCLFVNSGSEANDIAWRMAKSHTGHEGALVMTHAYHGITDAITALSPAICPKVPPHVEQLAAPALNSGAAEPPLKAAHATRSANATPSARPTPPSPDGLAAAADPKATATAGANQTASAAPQVTATAGADRTATADPQLTATAIATAAERDVITALARLKTRGFNPAALMIDSALTSTGIFDPPPTWITPIVAAVRAAGGLIIGDEVQFGLGRSGSHFWGFTRRGYHPDIVTLGKPVGNGYPLGVVVTRRAILEKFQRDTGFFSTFGGNPVAAAAGLAVLDVLDKERLVDNARTTGDYFVRRLRELAESHSRTIRDVRGCGLMIGVEVPDRAIAKRVVNGLRERGVLIGSEGPLGNVLKLRPPMPFHMEHVEIVIDALTSTLSADRP